MRLLRDAVARPAIGGGEQGILDGVLGGVEVAVAANERAEDPRRVISQQVLDVGWDVQRRPFAVSRNASISSMFDGASSMI